jgi:hypothetical protein
MDEKNSHGQDDDNHSLHQKNNQRITWQTQKPLPPQNVKCDKRRKI